MVARTVEALEDNLVMKWHLNADAIKKMVQDGLADGMDGITMDDFKKTPLKCMACEETKAKRMAFQHQIARAKYFQLIQDEASCYKWVYLLNKKSEAADNVMTLILQLEKDYPVKIFSCDQGGELMNHRLATFFREHGIRLLTTDAYTPEENCLVEKLNRKLLSKVRAVREAANLPACLWGEILSYVVHIDNMSATKALKDMTPFEKLKNRKPDAKNWKVCGCVAYYHVPKEKQANKLDTRARPALFLDLAESTLGYRLLDLKTGEVLQRRSVSFREDVAVGDDYVKRLIAKQYYGKQTVIPTEIPFELMPVTRVAIVDGHSESSVVLPGGKSAEEEEEKRPTQVAQSEESDSSSDESDWEYLGAIDEVDDSHGNDGNHGGACGATGRRTNAAATAGAGANGDLQGARAGGSAATSADTTGAGTSGSSTASTAGASADGGSASGTTQSGGSARAKTTRTSTNAVSQAMAAAPRRSGRRRRSNSKYDSSTWVMALTLMQCMLIGAVNNILNPMARRVALASEHAEGWCHAMNKENTALMMNGTWELVPHPKKRKGRPNILSSVWVLVAKHNEKGEVERLKARLAIRGFLQKFGLDYLETYSPVVRIESVGLIMLIAMSLGLECKHIDFVTAFLNGELVDVVIYMKQPESYEDGTDRVCRLRKGLYGLKQASKIWNDTLHKVVLE
ncbi:hypothetical protein PR003_g19146 [Phytophthora rubi]|uniref:Integrase catalytic domain-containing protein n=2 Tax=Phytophthora TaxID=4783 RepID=A0A6A4DYT0_9STRA|nr:hypothetical protein PR001_g17724 [Phytophthora rubi]KAE9314813.1 hypothetical protein PR003_g19146 [Phytophthora rubi]